ncbi:hypothetical protein BDB01DRAFT_850322 [Pilobolus umbonatus]|nr:hypothetical protein BDB01DRAFT_850322 [Pilobolus umbonatus]
MPAKNEQTRNEQKINETVDRVSNSAQEEYQKLKTEYEELKRKSQPKVREAENYLCSPSAISFYQGVLVGVVAVLGYAKYKGGLRFN